MAPPGQLGAQRYGGKYVARVPEGGEEEAAPLWGFAQTSSAISRTIRMRSSASKAIGVIIRVPTPASR